MNLQGLSAKFRQKCNGMKITKELIEAMGFIQKKINNGILVNIWNLKVNKGFFGLLVATKVLGNFIHQILLIPIQLRSFSFDDGIICGKRDFKNEIKKLLGIK